MSRARLMFPVPYSRKVNQMNDKEKIAELERQLAELIPNPPVLVRIEGIPQKIVSHGILRKGEKVYDKGIGVRYVPAIPVIEVVERKS